MKRVRVIAGYVGLVYKNGTYVRFVEAGTHWIGFSEEITVYNLAQPFYPREELNLLLKDELLKDKLLLVELKDTEVALVYKNGNYNSLLRSGRYAFWKGLIDYKFVVLDTDDLDQSKLIPTTLISKVEIADLLRIFVVESFEKGLLFINGKFERVLMPGIYYFLKNSTPVFVMKADLRNQQVEISGQELLTRDKAALRLSFFAKYRVVDIEKALAMNKDFEKQFYVLLQLSLREFVGEISLDEFLERKNSLTEHVLNSVKVKAFDLGIEVLDAGVRDIILPGEMREIMNQVLIAEKKAQANVITRREESASTRNLLNTAKLMADNDMLYKLKEMEYVEKIADKVSSISLNGNAQILDQLKTMFTRV